MFFNLFIYEMNFEPRKQYFRTFGNKINLYSNLFPIHNMGFYYGQ